MAASANAATPTRRSHWADQITKAKRRWETFQSAGTRVEEEYRNQKEDGNDRSTKDKYNLLYSSTETIMPNLYSQLPTVRVVLRNKDTAPDVFRDGAMLLQNCGQYLITEQDFDSVLDSVTQDLLLPGLAIAWVRYEPTFEYEKDAKGKAVNDNEGNPKVVKVLDEQVPIEYLYWKDFLTGVARTWDKVPWVAKRCWLTKEEATKRFGKKKADMLSYNQRERDGKDESDSADTAEVWEIWDKRTKTVFWYADSFADDLLDEKPDPLKLKRFFPCPKPLRAVYTNSRIVPKSLYSQYKDQQEQVNNLTRRIRLLTDALKVAGVYNGAAPKLADLISPQSGNRMIPIEDWHSFKGDGGIKGAVEWMPLTDVVNALTQLYAQREIAKAEIYEITGFSDILRGVSKASETLGAQNLKSQWGAARLKRMQKEVQRFARDLIAIAGEIIAEHCSEESIALYGGVIIPPVDPNDPQSAAAAQQAVERFKAAVAFIRNEGRRIAAIDIETDSTILADEAAEREDRVAMLGAAGAFLQQAVPAMEATPELGPLLGAMLMFTVRSFPTSRPIEDAFEAVSNAMSNRPPKQPEQPDQTKVQAAQIAAQTEAQRIQAETQIASADTAAKSQYEMGKLTNEQTAEANRHEEKMRELDIKTRELAIREQELAIREREVGIKQQEADNTAATDAARLELDASIADDDRDANQMELQFEADNAAVEQELRAEELKASREEAAEKPLTGSEE